MLEEKRDHLGGMDTWTRGGNEVQWTLTLTVSLVHITVGGRGRMWEKRVMSERVRG